MELENTYIWKVTPMIGGTHDCWVFTIQDSLRFLPSIMVQWKLTYYTCKAKWHVTYYWKDPISHFHDSGRKGNQTVSCSVVRPSWPLRYFLMREWTIGHSLLRCLKSSQPRVFGERQTKQISKHLSVVQISCPKWWKNSKLWKLHYSHYKVDPYPSCKLRFQAP